MRRIVLFFLFGLCLDLLTACAPSSGARAVQPAPIPSSPPVRDYWPTAGWRTAVLAAVGFDPALAARLETEVAGNLPFLNSVLIVKNGYLVHEAYYNGYDSNDLHPVNSVTKSVVSAVYGMALADGLIPGLDMNLGEALPAYFGDRAYRDGADITLGDLLQMRSGLAHDEGKLEEELAAVALDGGIDAGVAFLTGQDMADDALRSGVAHPPGEAWSYSSGDTNLLSAAFSALAGRSVSDYAAERLFPTLGVTDWDWIADANSVTIGGIGLELTPRDMAKFGYLVLNHGAWEGQQVIPAEWVRASTSPQSDGVFPGNGLIMPIDWYGMQWWNWKPEVFAGQRAIAAQGYAGQMVVLLPDLDMIVVTTAETFVPPDVAQRQMGLIYEMMKSHVVPDATPGRPADPFWALPETAAVPHSDLYTAGADGRNRQVALDDAEKTLWGPSISPDGQQVVFSRSVPGPVVPGLNPAELHIADLNGDNMRQLTNNGRANYLPAWSPDGTMIAFVSGHIGWDSHEIHVIRADGSGEMPLTDNEAQEYGVTWSPDGSKLAFGTNREGAWRIYTMNPDGSEQETLPTAAEGHSPTWSPDGRRIAFTSERSGDADIFTMNADGSNQSAIAAVEVWDFLPVWSPDGSRIAFTSTRDGSAAVYVMDPDGEDMRRVSGPDLIAETASWTPDNSRLFFNGLAAPRRGLFQRLIP